ncbi:MAG: bifunctional diguanylate cyclase/phosphodiesterase [Potamolinea sp.]
MRFIDRLTGLANRALFMDRLKQAVRRAKQSRRGDRSGRPYLFAVLLLNLNRFKLVNDSFGNQIGDQLLQGFAQRLQTCLRPTDTVARMGGDEFAVLIEGIQDVSEATRLADTINETLSVPFLFNKSEVFVTLSIGIALNTIGNEKPEYLLRDADLAMYRAKAHGKSCYEVFDTGMYNRAVDKLQIETDLRRAIERQEFLVFYQPIVSLSTNKITGFEALVRWQHPQRGLVTPSKFIPVAEETGLITNIGWWTLREACRQLKVWQENFPYNPPLTMNVNLSCKQFTQLDLLEQIDQILQETQLASGSLKLEITESVFMDNVDFLKALLLELKKRNIHLCIDDFGTGYSSLSRLHDLPISTLKIDQSFVSRLGVRGEKSQIIQAIMTLAENLSMDVVAEGIEVSEQVSRLVALQCKYGQGYFFSKPVDSDAARELLIREG